MQIICQQKWYYKPPCILATQIFTVWKEVFIHVSKMFIGKGFVKESQLLRPTINEPEILRLSGNVKLGQNRFKEVYGVKES